MEFVDTIVVDGLSHFQCKVLSHQLTALDGNIQGRQHLAEIGLQNGLDCTKCSFRIARERLDVLGYGRDRSGGLIYLRSVLEEVTRFNGQQVLTPVHCDPDGHCLVHAVSRCLTGLELLWHCLRMSLKRHIATNLEQYATLFNGFFDDTEWIDIIEECDVNYQPPFEEMHGLRLVHVFALANMLGRVIILFDSLTELHKCGGSAG